MTQYTYDNLGNLTQTVGDAGAGRLNQTTHMGYDVVGNPATSTDPNGNITTNTWDANRRPVTVTTPPAPLVLTTALTYDPNGNLLESRQSSGGQVLRTTSATYTRADRIATSTDAKGNVTRYAYDTDDRLSRITDPVGNVTVLGYDALSRPDAVSNPAIQANPLTQKAYTADGLPASLTIARSNTVADTTSYTYDGFDRLMTTAFPDASAESLTYDANGNMLTRQTRKGDTIAFAYDTLNRVCTKTYATTPVACGGSSASYLASYGWDLAGRLIAVGDNSAAVTRPAASASYVASTTYDAMNRPLQVGWSPAVAQTTPTASGTTFTYSYDATNRRIGATASDKSWWSYPTAAGTTSYTANNLNQYSAVGSVSPTYDQNGNLGYDGTFTYGYDAESRLVSVKQGATAVARYAWDAQGRRKSKTVGSTTTMFVTDADNREVLEYDGTSGAIGKWYSFAPAAAMGPDAVLNEMDVAAGARQTLIPDVQGSVVGTLASGGALTKIGYQSFGEHPSLAAGSFRYAARRYDAETTGSAAQPSGLYYYRARMYSPTWGRFLEPDPIGYAGGPNLYAYVENDPLNELDPYGLWGIYGAYGLTAVAGSGPFVAATATNLSSGAQYQINGVVGTAQVGIGAFIGGGQGPSVGGFVTSQAEITGLTPSGSTTVASAQPTLNGAANGVLGASVGFGRGIGITTANSPADLSGPAHVTQLDLGLISLQYLVGQSSNGTPVRSLSIGGTLGIGLSSYDTNTSTAQIGGK